MEEIQRALTPEALEAAKRALRPEREERLRPAVSEPVGLGNRKERRAEMAELRRAHRRGLTGALILA